MLNRPCCLAVKQFPVKLLFLCTFFIILSACSGGNVGNMTPGRTPATSQVLRFPNVGITNIAVLDPALGPDANSALAVTMIFSGLVRSDKDLNVVPDQAIWHISADGKTYTFTLRPGITFSDGTPVTAQSYIYSWTRALLPSVGSPVASLFEAPIVGANDVASGKTKVLTGVQALDDHTLQVTLIQPAPYFLEALTNWFFFPLNEKLVRQYGDKNWTLHAAGSGIGTGPFMVKEWDQNIKMVLVPNPHYYGNKTKLTEVDMTFVSDPSTAFKSYRANQYDFVWNILAADQQTALGMPGFLRTPLLQTDLLFFDNSKPPFDRSEVRQAFAYALDRTTLVHAIFKDSVASAPTIIPPGMPGFQSDYQGLSYDPSKAKSLLQQVYPDVTKVPPITFSYPSSQVTSQEAAALQQMWQTALGIQVKLNAVELTAYNDQTAKRQIQFGFTQWSADFPDPYDWLYLNLLSTAQNNNGLWHNPQFDDMLKRAETLTGDERIKLYNQAEQTAITGVGWLPIDHQAMAAVIPSTVHGVTLNGLGLFFGDWSGVYLSS